MLRWAYSLPLVVLMASPAWAGYDEGMAAYKQGNYAVALREFRPLAEQGVKPAQLMLGNMHLSGEGVPQNYAEAMRWYRKAAEKGFVGAQIVLGVIHLNAVGVAKDYVVAHMWFNIAASGPPTGIEELDRKTAASARDKVARRMTPAQVAEAQRLAREWWAKHGKK